MEPKNPFGYVLWLFRSPLLCLPPPLYAAEELTAVTCDRMFCGMWRKEKKISMQVPVTSQHSLLLTSSVFRWYLQIHKLKKIETKINGTCMNNVYFCEDCAVWMWSINWQEKHNHSQNIDATLNVQDGRIEWVKYCARSRVTLSIKYC